MLALRSNINQQNAEIFPLDPKSFGGRSDETITNDGFWPEFWAFFAKGTVFLDSAQTQPRVSQRSPIMTETTTSANKVLFGVHPTWTLGTIIVLASLLIFQWI